MSEQLLLHSLVRQSPESWSGCKESMYLSFLSWCGGDALGLETSVTLILRAGLWFSDSSLIAEHPSERHLGSHRRSKWAAAVGSLFTFILETGKLSYHDKWCWIGPPVLLPLWGREHHLGFTVSRRRPKPKLRKSPAMLEVTRVAHWPEQICFSGGEANDNYLTDNHAGFIFQSV